ncbi:cubilin [Folsomia candida]|uniref:Bone morphogenetic protein 1 n=1 Tax=Folsomia candida TaxID=158441 RepID=A0A226DNS9_FOLCA|nr:cubilin [Folsomia candida]OXA46307.1 Bone morphogenetic protein 1 [Folsomia candida]
MSPSFTLVYILACVAAVFGAPGTKQAFPEDPEPINTVTECGGLIDTSSAALDFLVSGSIPAGTRCLWTVQAPYDHQRFILTSSGLGNTSSIYLTAYSSNAEPGIQQRVTTIGQNHTIVSNVVLVTLIVSENQIPIQQGFSLHFFSSGDAATTTLAGHASITAANGSFTYPAGGGQYPNDDHRLFTFARSGTPAPTIRFTRVDLESDSECSYDFIRTYVWFDNLYLQVARFCGSTIPPSFTIPDGLALLAFGSDSSVTGSGFTFEWE